MKQDLGLGNIQLHSGTKSSYDFKAKLYERLVRTNLFNFLHWNTLPKYYTNFAREAILENEGSLIDIGCGGLSQTASLYLSTQKKCTLVDQSIEMLKVAEKRLMNDKGKIPQNIKLIQGNAFHLPFEEKSFDTLCSFGTLHLFDDKELFINQILKVLKKGGHFYMLSMTNKYWNSSIFMKALRMFGEFGKVCSPDELLQLFPCEKYKVEHYTKGSVLFINGQKL